VKFLYDEEWYNPALYDLSINLKVITIEAACKMIAALLQSGMFATTEQSVRRLNSLSLECEVRAAIASDDSLWDQKISVDADGSTIILSGQVKNKKSREAIAQIASQVKGVAELKDEMYLRSEALSRSRHAGGRS
jgi:hypothetical protein